jgi:hypothetical protein
MVYSPGKVFHQYKAEDLIWYLNISRKEAVYTKLQAPYSGPFLVKEEKLSDQKYAIQFLKSRDDTSHTL